MDRQPELALQDMHAEEEPGAPAPCDRGISIEVELVDAINAATHQNDVPVLQRVEIANRSGETLRDLTLHLSFEPAFAREKRWSFDAIEAGRTVAPRDRDVVLDPGFLFGLTEAVRGEARFRLETADGRVLAQTIQPVRLLTRQEWGGLAAGPELLAAFVMPNDPAIDGILKGAAEVLERAGRPRSLDGYQSGEPRRAYELASAMWSSVASLGIDYANPPASFERTGQKVRLPSVIKETGLATCLDTTLLFAGALEAAGLNPLLVVQDGHTLAGVWLRDDRFQDVVERDAVEIRKRRDLRELVLFETTRITARPPAPFDAALREGQEAVSEPREADFVLALDVRRARERKITPLSSPSAQSAGERAEEGGVAAPLPLSPAPDLPQVAREEERPETPKGRLDRWQRKLLDLSKRNRLLNFRNAKGEPPRSAVAFLCPDPSRLEDRLADGAKIRVKPLPDLRATGRDADLHRERTGDDLLRDHAARALENDEVVSPLSPEELEKRLIGLYRQAKNDLAEGGTNTLFLAVGFLAWKEKPDAQRRYFAPLLLVPVALERRSVTAGVRLVAHEDEPRFNLTLVEMLKQDFDLSLPWAEEALPGDERGIHVPQVLERMRAAVRDVPGFEVVEDIALATFSFAKYLMWKDLVDRTEQLKESPVVRHLIETPRDPYQPDGTVPPAFPAPERLDVDYPPRAVFCPLPSDASQLAAAMAAAEGRDFVLIGPPGTGKSQTIANMISQCLAEGRTVLFVAEKTAALDVVYRRLRQHGLGAFCLELHSAKARKAEVLEQLREAWTPLAGAPHDWESETQRLGAARAALNRLVDRLHTTYANGLTPYEAFGRVVAGTDRFAPRLAFAGGGAAHDGQARAAMTAALEKLATLAPLVEGADHERLRHVAAADWSPQFEQHLIEAADRLADTAAALSRALSHLGEALGLRDAGDGTAARVDTLVALLDALAAAGGEDLSFALNADDAALDRTLGEARTAAARYGEAEAGPGARFAPEALERLPLQEVEAAWTKAGLSMFLLAFFRKRRIQKLLQSFVADGRADAQRDLRRLRAMRDSAGILAASPLATAMPDLWRGAEIDFEAVQARIGQARAVSDALRALTPADAAQLGPVVRQLVGKSRALLASGNELHKATGALSTKHAAFREAVRDYTSVAQTTPFEEEEPRILAACATLAEGLHSARRRLRDWTLLRGALDAARHLGLAPICDALSTGALTPDELLPAFHLAYARWFAECVVTEDQALRRFTGAEHERLIASFRDLDEHVREITTAHIRARLAAGLPAHGDVTRASELGVLKRELEKRKRHKPLRQLFSEMPTALTRLTPCLLMSPLSVAQYLPAGQAQFDVVIFDEASQIATWDAVGAIARARQAVIVGDPKQLPPTNFFARAESEEMDAEDAPEADLESILDEALGANLPERMLEVHYRSRSESLIAFSNARYYGGRLVTFPSPATSDRALRFVHVSDGAYARGTARTNRKEAEAVVGEALARMAAWLKLEPETRPTLGIVTFNSQQQDLMLDLLDAARRREPALEWFFAENRTEPTMVKNLENVQGDERDVMLFSLTYGPDEAGKFPMNFGPMNKQGGERRLNVAVTRARSELMVFASFTPDLIDMRRTRAQGVADLKLFLEFAERGPVALAAEARGSGDHESPFEHAVADALAARGWTVQPQVGISGYRIDLGIVHPDAPGRFLAGVECDGATYHSSATARDRDKLRQSVLEGLGWSIVRTWSTDWYFDPVREAEKLDARLRSLLEQDRAKAPTEFSAGRATEPTEAEEGLEHASG